jgi:hypothetical protein
MSVQFRAATASARVTAVIVNWNTRDLLDACLRSLRDHGPDELEVVVVDNGSHDGSVALIERSWPAVKLIANTENRGYQAANNQGMRAATGDVLLLVNADAMLTPGCLGALLRRLDLDPRAAVVGPRLAYGDGTFQRWTAGRLPSLGAAACYFFFADRLLARSGLWLGRDVDRPFTPGWVSSACMVVRRAALTDVGLMDERFFAYMDDVDLCARARAAGWRVWYEPAGTAIHLMGQSTRRRTGEASPLALESFLRWYALHRGRVSFGCFRAIAAAGFGLRALLYSVAGLVRPARRAAARAHARNARRTLGPVARRVA